MTPPARHPRLSSPPASPVDVFIRSLSAAAHLHHRPLSEATHACFSMMQPYAALVLHRHKTLETRGTPFLQAFEGHVLLVHVGSNDWPEHRGGMGGWLSVAPPELFEREGSSAGCERWKQACALPSHITRGMVAGAVEVGPTRLTSEWAARDGWDAVERRALVPRESIARYSTELRAARWLKHGVRAKGFPEVWSIALAD